MVGVLDRAGSLAAPDVPTIALHPDKWRPFTLVAKREIASDALLLRFALPAGLASVSAGRI